MTNLPESTCFDHLNQSVTQSHRNSNHWRNELKPQTVFSTVESVLFFNVMAQLI